MLRTRHQLTLKKNKAQRTSPERTCIGCRTRRPAAELVRFGAEDGHLKLGRNVSGRGAWLCADLVDDCFRHARRRAAIGRALAQDVTEAQLDELAQALSASKDSG